MIRRPSTLLASFLALAGCAGSGEPPIECYPGDKDCNESAGGKGEEWNNQNNPRHLSQNLDYVLDNLPLNGQSEVDPWAASYWPTVEGSSNYRWQGEDVLSPLEKYDVAFNGWTATEEYSTSVPDDCGPDAAEEYQAYVDTRGPAAKWQSTAQSRHLLFNGVNDDSDEDDEIDECHEVLEGWWGLCHAWAPAAILEPEPLNAVELNGERFEVSDIKALIITAYDDTDSLMLGGRCNAEEIEHDETGRATAPECRDTNAGAWHVVVTNFLGVNGKGFIEDRTGGFQVWNQPLTGYEITMLEEIDVERANELLNVDGDEYIYNSNFAKLYEVEMSTDYLVEGSQSRYPLGSEGYIHHDYYHYIIEVDENGKVAGGEWVGSSIDNHPDFLWVPVQANTSSWSRSNPHIDLEQVRELIEMSRGGEEPIEGDSYTFEGSVSIPDDNSEGATATVTVPDDFVVGGMSVAVEISHSYVGDLELILIKGATSKVLRNQEGGDQENLSQTFRVSDFDGMSAEGDWTLKAVDHAGADTGTIDGVTLTFQSAE